MWADGTQSSWGLRGHKHMRQHCPMEEHGTWGVEGYRGPSVCARWWECSLTDPLGSPHKVSQAPWRCRRTPGASDKTLT